MTSTHSETSTEKNRKTTQILIVRHGNTFAAGETPRRVGGRTDLPLVENEKAKAIGKYLRNHFPPDQVFCSPLLRTQQTAKIALDEAALSHTPFQLDNQFIEIDYGPDENKIEQDVIDRIGLEALQAWNEQGIVPDGWDVDTKKLKQSWHQFFDTAQTEYPGKRLLVVTSNGVARFAPDVLQEASTEIHSLKMKTGHMSLFQLNLKGLWECAFWDRNPA